MKKFPWLFWLLIVSVIVSGRSYAFTLNNNIEAGFTNSTITLDVASTSCDHIGLSHEDLLQLGQMAMDQYWNSVPTSRIRVVRGQVVKVDDAIYKTAALCTADSYASASEPCRPNPLLNRTGGILLVCNQNTRDFSVNSNVLAATLPQVRNRAIDSAIILLNDLPPGSSPNPLKELGHNQWLSLLAHEVGHAIGIGHSEVVDSLMYFSIIPQREKLGWDDIDGVTYLYPKNDHLAGIKLGFCGGISPPDSVPPFWGNFLMGGAFSFLLWFLFFPLFRPKRA